MTSPAQSEPDQSTTQQTADTDSANANMLSSLALVLIAAISLVAVSTVFGLIFAAVAGTFDHEHGSDLDGVKGGETILLTVEVPTTMSEPTMTITAGDREVSRSVAEFLLASCEPNYVRVIDMVNSYATCVPVWSIDPTGQVVVNPQPPAFRIPTVSD